MPKAIKINGGHVIRCHVHGEHIVPAERWTFNGNLDSPTFSPSVRHYEPPLESNGWKRDITNCHYTITDGKICYHGDNTHAMAGQTVEMLEFDQAAMERYAGPGYQE